MNIPEEFYNEFGNKLLTDYAYGNPRIISAIDFTLKNISIKHKHILDIGCGIGWSSFEIARNCPESIIDAIDLSPNSIKIANTLFHYPNLTFIQTDVTSDQFSALKSKYDLIIMIDVLEHISLQERSSFLINLEQKLNESAMIILTFPSPEHQKWLSINSTAVLQPVDETIELNDLLDISNQLKGKVIFFKYKSIWHLNDYNYAIIKRGLNFSTKTTEQRKIRILNFKERKKLLVKGKLYSVIDWAMVQKLIRNDHPGRNYYKKIKQIIKKISR